MRVVFLGAIEYPDLLETMLSAFRRNFNTFFFRYFRYLVLTLKISEQIQYLVTSCLYSRIMAFFSL